MAISDFIEADNRKWAALKADDAAAKAKNTLVGRYIQHSYADSYAVYKITAQGRATVSIEVVDVGDAWVLPAWGKRATIKLSDAKAFVAQRDALDELFSATDNWWAKQKIGATVHYRNGFGSYVRGVIIDHEGQKHMLPTALVGKWAEWDLYRRSADGEVHYGHHARLIIEKEPFQPNASNIVEYDPRDGEKPAALPVVSFEPPALTDAQTKLASVAKLHKEVQAALDYQHSGDLLTLADNIRNALLDAKRLLSRLEG